MYRGWREGLISFYSLESPPQLYIRDLRASYSIGLHKRLKKQLINQFNRSIDSSLSGYKTTSVFHVAEAKRGYPN